MSSEVPNGVVPSLHASTHSPPASPSVVPAPPSTEPTATLELKEALTLTVDVAPVAGVVAKELESAEQTPAGRKVDVIVTTVIPAYGSRQMLSTLVGVLLFVWCFGWLYIGAAWNPQARIKFLNVAVLDCDYGVPAPVQQQLPASLAPVASKLAAQPLGETMLAGSIWNTSNAASRIFRWHKYACGAAAHGCPLDQELSCLKRLQNSIMQGKYFAAIYLPGNLSTTFITTAIGTNTSAQLRPMYLHYIKASGRQVSTYNYITAYVQSLVKSLSYALGATTASTPSLAPSINPYWYLAGPLQLLTTDLAPVLHFGQYFATYILQMLVWISSIVVVAIAFDFYLPAEAAALMGGPPPSHAQVMRMLAIRLAVAAAATLVACILMMSIILILGHGGHIQFERYNAGVAIAFIWYCSFTYMSLNGVLIHAFGPAKFSTFSTFLLILQLASSTAVFAHELTPAFYKIGWALPFFWGVRGLRTIFFGVLDETMWLTWVVLTAWNLLSVATTVAMMTAKARGNLRWPGVMATRAALKHAAHASSTMPLAAA